MPVYRTTGLSVNIPARGNRNISASGAFNSPPRITLNSANIQLSGIPDKLIIFVRKVLANRLSCDTDSYLSITGIRINFNNQAGLLSSMSQQQLYTSSVYSGLNNMSYDEFSGLTLSVSSNSGSGISAPLEPYSGLGSKQFGANAGDCDPGFKYIPTTGSILVLNFADVIQLTDEYYSPGSLGTFNLQFQVDVENNHKVQWLANEIELVVIPINSGIFCLERGTSSTFISLLTKQDVLSSLEQEPCTNFEVHRMVGGSSFTDNLRNGMRHLWSKIRESGALNQLGTAAKTALASSGNPYGLAASAAMGALGYGRGSHRPIGDRVN